MTYYEDLSPCSYFGLEARDRLIAVGWLEKDHIYTRGKVSEDFLDRLIEFLAKPWAPMYFMGFHDCPFCSPSEFTHEMAYKGTTIQIGALNLFVPANGFLYVAPSLIAHYILAHEYTPPAKFCEAVMKCPPMHSTEYLADIKKNAPKKFADRIKL